MCFSTESQVTITPHFSSPLRVLEGQPVTLNWTYSIQGSSFRRAAFGISGSNSFIVDAFFIGPPIIRDDRVTLNITGTNVTIITFGTVNRNDTNVYVFTVEETNGEANSSFVEIIVKCK